jgi:transposase
MVAAGRLGRQAMTSTIGHAEGKVIVLSVVEQGLTNAEAARRFDVSWQWVHTLVTRYQAGGSAVIVNRWRRDDVAER